MINCRSSINSIFQSLTISTTTPTITCELNLRTKSSSIQYSSNTISCSPTTRISKKFQTNKPNIPVHTNDAHTIVTNTTYSSSAMCTMTMTICRVIIIIGKIPPLKIIYITIPIIVNTICRSINPICIKSYFSRIAPKITHKIFMCQINTSINNRHNNTCRSSSNIPSLWRLNTRHSPKTTILRIIWRCISMHNIIRLHHNNIRIICIYSGSTFKTHAGWHNNLIPINKTIATLQLSTHTSMSSSPNRSYCINLRATNFLEFNQQFPRHNRARIKCIPVNHILLRMQLKCTKPNQ